MSITFRPDLGETMNDETYAHILRLRKEQGIGVMPDFDAIERQVREQNNDILTRTARMNADQERKNNEVREQSAERDRQRQAAGDALLAKQNAEQQLIHRGEIRALHLEKLLRDDATFVRLCHLIAPDDESYQNVIEWGL